MYEKEIWEFLEKDKTFADSDILIKVVEGDDLVLLRQMQSLVNKDMKIEGE